MKPVTAWDSSYRVNLHRPVLLARAFVPAMRVRNSGLFVCVSSVGMAIAIGRRAGCHAICWIAPFMILGRKLRNVVNWPALRLKADNEACINCKKCTKNCPMSLDVNAMVQEGVMENSECVLCGSCVHVCPKDVIRYSFSAGK